MKKNHHVLIILFLIFTGASIKAQYKTLVNFNGSNGQSPTGSLLFSGNVMYGLSALGGANSDGCMFSVDTNGGSYTILYSFTGLYPSGPKGSLILSGNTFYAMTFEGGVNLDGNVFSINKNGTGYTDLLDFNGSNGNGPLGDLTISGNRLFGMTHYGGTNNEGCVFAINTNGTGYKKLIDFNGTNGQSPETGGLVISGKRLYGMTSGGGAHSNGLVFAVDTDGSGFKDVLDFNGTNGQTPYGSLILSGGRLYGMTSVGGTIGYGVIFGIDTNGANYKDLYNCAGTSGHNPQGGLTLSGRTLYGMCESSTSAGCLFLIDSTGTGYKDLYEFWLGGQYPTASLVISGNGLFGMTPQGGTAIYGVIFSFREDSILGINSLANNINSKPSVYPNPNNGEFTVSLASLKSQENFIEVYNILGEKVYNGNINATHTQIDLTDKPNGIYLYKVISRKGELDGEGKLIIQR